MQVGTLHVKNTLSQMVPFFQEFETLKRQTTFYLFTIITF